MSLLSELKTILSSQSVPVETGIFSGAAPDTYAVLYPLFDEFEVYADNKPNYDIQSVRIELFTKGNYKTLKNKIVKALLRGDITVTSRQYVGFEEDTKYHHYSIDCENHYKYELEE